MLNSIGTYIIATFPVTSAFVSTLLPGVILMFTTVWEGRRTDHWGVGVVGTIGFGATFAAFIIGDLFKNDVLGITLHESAITSVIGVVLGAWVGLYIELKEAGQRKIQRLRTNGVEMDPSVYNTYRLCRLPGECKCR
ncbi:MAG: hypothetical protein AAB790_00590 [Patescibacteria group bacterium]